LRSVVLPGDPQAFATNGGILRGVPEQPGSPEADAFRLAGLRQGLKEGGFVEGQNLTIEYRWVGNDFDRLPALAADLVHHGVAVIVAPGSRSTFAAKTATPTIPIVFGSGADPVQGGLVASLNRPGGNLTGVNVFGGEIASKGLELLHELLPAAASIGFLEDRSNPIAELRTRDILAAARAIGVELKRVHAGTESEIDAAFASLVQAHAGALLVPAAPLIWGQMVRREEPFVQWKAAAFARWQCAL
jgi:putative ABC transport system substrate-binding protein